MAPSAVATEKAAESAKACLALVGGSGLTLPFPLTEKALAACSAELPDGTRRATETCLKCWKDRKFTSEDLLSFVTSIAAQSATLSKLLLDPARDKGTAKTGSALNKSAATTPALRPQVSVPFQPLHAYSSAGQGAGNNKGEEALDMSAKLIQRRREESKRRQLDSYAGTDAGRRNSYLSGVMRKLAQQLPAAGKLTLLRCIRSYVAKQSTPEDFVEKVQQIVDEYGAIVTLDYTPECSLRRSLYAPSAVLGKRSSERNAEQNKRSKAAASGATAATPRSVSSATDESLGDAGSPQEWAAADRSQDEVSSIKVEAGACSEKRNRDAVPATWPAQSPLSSSVLRETPLGIFLTSRAQAACKRTISVKVVSQTEHPAERGHSPYLCKAIFAFQEVEGCGEIVLFGMYVHEFGPDAAAGVSGRVLIECIDSIPLLETETGEERQKLLTAIIHAYVEDVRNAGFRQLHLRISPASDESSHIFNFRSLGVRMEATVRMAHWYKRLLESAKTVGLVASVQTFARLSTADNFPAAVLPPCHVEAEEREEMKQLMSAAEPGATRAPAAKARFFVAELYRPDERSPPLRREAGERRAPAASSEWWSAGADGGAERRATVAGSRLEFVEACRVEHLSFNNLSAAKFSTMYLVSRMAMDQLHASAQRRAEARGARDAAADGDCDDGDGAPVWETHDGGDDGQHAVGGGGDDEHAGGDHCGDGAMVWESRDDETRGGGGGMHSHRGAHGDDEGEGEAGARGGGGGGGGLMMLLAPADDDDAAAGGGGWGDLQRGERAACGGGGRSADEELFADSLFSD